jgi:DNA repair protein RecO (recombination protein O)
MLEKTKGILLHQLKYNDSAVIVQFYTKDYGRQSFIIRGVRGKRKGNQAAMLQPMSVLELVAYFKRTREVQPVKEYTPSFVPLNIHNNIKKSCIALFLGEVLSSVLREEAPNSELFGFIEDSVMYLDAIEEPFSNFHIAFLAGLSGYLGFEPDKSLQETGCFFDLMNGNFCIIPPSHGNYATSEVSGILLSFFNSSFNDIMKYPLSGTIRNEVLETILRYYSLHLPGLRKIRSLEILHEVFR